MKCRCGHAAEHHAMQGRNARLSFCVEQCCPCEAYSPKRHGPKLTLVVGAMLMLGCSDPPQNVTEKLADCQKPCEIARVDCETPHHSYCSHCCSGDDSMCETLANYSNPSCMAQCYYFADNQFCLPQYDNCMAGCTP